MSQASLEGSKPNRFIHGIMDFFHSDKVKMALAIVLGLVLLFFGTWLDKFFGYLIGDNMVQHVAFFLLGKIGFTLSLIGGLFGILGVLALIAKPIITPIVNALWGENKTTNELLTEICSQISKKMPVIDTLHDTYMLKKICDQRKDHILQLVDERIEGVLPSIENISVVYGMHSIGKDSFYSFMHRQYLRPYCKAPHMSNLNMAVNIDLIPGDSKHLNWSEINKYHVHNPMHSTGIVAPYHIILGFCGVIGKQEISEWTKTLGLSLTIGEGSSAQQIIIDNVCKEVSEISEMSEDEVLYILRKKDGVAQVKYTKTINLTEEFTYIETVEDSIMDITDKEFKYKAVAPIYKMTANINIPIGWTFNKNLSTYYDDIDKYINSMYRGGISKDNVVHGENVTKQRFQITAEGWIPPGIAFSISWDKVGTLGRRK